MTLYDVYTVDGAFFMRAPWSTLVQVLGWHGSALFRVQRELADGEACVMHGNGKGPDYVVKQA